MDWPRLVLAATVPLVFIGIIVGTYSSIFVASPLVYYMDIYLKRREEAQKKANKLHQPTPAGA